MKGTRRIADFALLGHFADPGQGQYCSTQRRLDFDSYGADGISIEEQVAAQGSGCMHDKIFTSMYSLDCIFLESVNMYNMPYF